MPSTISAGTTAGTAIAVAGDTTGNLAFQTNGTTTAMTIDTSQNVLVGTTTPLYSLAGRGLIELNGSTNSLLALKRNNASDFYIHNNSGSVDVYNNANTPMTFATNGTERMRIDSSGRVTIPFQAYCLVGKSNGNVSPPNVIVHNQIAANIGSSYNNSNGRFTAPVSGNYYISINALGTTSNGVEVSIRKNGGTVLNSRGGGAANYTSTSTSSVVYLAAGDYLENWAEGAYAIEGNNGYAYTGMAVYLLG